MAGEDSQPRELRNDTAVNVAGLLKGQTGATRSYRLVLDAFDADGETIARDVDGDVRLTRLGDGIIARVKATGVVAMTCARCLRECDQPFEVNFDEEYRQTVDVRTGLDLDDAQADDDLSSLIDENHELDLREPLRQEILVALPMRPDCGAECPGPDVLEVGDEESGDVVDERLAALASLLGDERGNETR
ncbi:MAG: YceD family protein [Thermomicrobiales bacterium]